MPKQAKTISLDVFKGINNVDSPEDIGNQYLQAGNNIDISDSGNISKRDGYTKIKAGKAHSLFSTVSDTYCVIDGVLLRNFQVELGSGYDTQLHYLELQNKIYFTSTSHTGIIDGDTIVPWKPEDKDNFLQISSWEDQFGNEYGAINHKPSFYADGPQGQLIAGLGGRIYIAVGDTVLFSEPMAPIWWKGQGITFNSRVTALMPVESGMWICADALYYFAGLDPSQFKANKLEVCKGIEGTAVKTPGDRVPIDKSPAGDTWLFTTSNGILALKDNGFIANLSESKYELPYDRLGSSGFIETGGINRYVTNIQGSVPNRAAVSDSITMRVIKNKV